MLQLRWSCSRVAHEPSIDYVVTKIPRFAFEKFPQADPTLTTQMKSVGEAMAIGRTFRMGSTRASRVGFDALVETIFARRRIRSAGR